MDIKTVISKMKYFSESDNISVSPMKSVEDGEEYDVWRVSTSLGEYVLKESSEREIAVYSEFFSSNIPQVPKMYASSVVDGKYYILMEFVHGSDLCKCTREGITKALDALISIQKKYWNSTPKYYDESLISRKKRGEYLLDPELEAVYSKYLKEYERLPVTLCHDDLLPFNVIVTDERAVIIDWECAGVLPYPTSLCRLISHTETDPEYIFYMSEDDLNFAVSYYYDNLVRESGISYEEYRRTLDLFIFYEYCEWIMVGNKYPNAPADRVRKYIGKAKEHIKNLK